MKAMKDATLILYSYYYLRYIIMVISTPRAYKSENFHLYKLE